MTKNNSVVKIQNLVVNHESRPIKSNLEQSELTVKQIYFLLRRLF